jgi:hypothetical protein
MIRNFNDLLRNAPTTVATWEKWDAWGGVTDNKGNIWGIPRMTPTIPYPIFIREDWLKRLNMTMPTTFDQLEAYLYAAKAADLFGNGQTIPLITRGTDLNALEWAFVAGFVKSGRGNWLDPADNRIKPLQLAPGYRDFLAKMAKWYADGIINRENIVWDVTTVREQIGRGRVAASATWYSDITLQNPNLKTNAPGASFNIYDPGITGLNGQKIQTISKAGTTALMMSVKTRIPEDVMKLIEWSYSDWYHYNTEWQGIENVHWKYADEPNAKENRRTVTIAKTGSGNSGYFGEYVMALGLPMETLSIVFDPDGTRNMHNIWICDKLGNFDSSYRSFEQNIFYNTVEARNNIQNYDDFGKFIAEELVKFITGERPLSSYDGFIQELYTMGLDSWIAEFTKQYNERK